MKKDIAVPDSMEIHLFNLMPGNCVLLLPDSPGFTIIAATQGYLQLTGNTKEELVGLKLFDFLANDNDKQACKNLESALQEVLNSKEPRELRDSFTKISLQAGDRFWNCSNKPLVDNAGNIKYIIHSIEDATNLFKAEQNRERIVDLEKHYNLFMQAPVTIGIVKGASYIIELANENLLEVWGRTPEVVGKPLFEAIPELKTQGFRDLLDEVRRTGVPFHAFEFPIRLERNGREEDVYFNFVYHPYYDKITGEIAGIFAVGHDVTIQVQSRRKAEESEQRFRDLIEQATVATGVYIGRDLRIEYVNDAMVKIIGKGNAVVGKTFLEVLPEMQGQNFVQHLNRVYTTGETYIGQEDRAEVMVDGKMQTFYFNHSYKALKNSRGEVYGILNMAIDVTEQVVSTKRLKGNEAALRRSEQNFRSMIHQAPVAIGILRGENYVVEVANPLMASLLGRSVDEVTGKLLFEGVPELRDQGLQEQLQKISTSRMSFLSREQPFQLQRGDGLETRYITYIYEPLGEIEGSEPGIIAVATDVTEQVTARRKLEEANQELQFVTDTMPQLVWATEPDGSAVFFNKGWFDYTGFSLENLKGDGWLQTLHPDDREKSLAAWKDAVQKTGSFDVEYRVRSCDGSYRWFVARGVPMRNGDGEITKWYGTSTDINDQRLVLEALKQSHERFNLVSQATQDAIWDWDLNTNELWWNESYKSLFGYKAEDISPGVESWISCLHPDEKDKVLNGINQVIDSGGKQWSHEYRFRRADGSYATVYDRGYALHNAEGKPYRMLGSMQDVSEQKKYEASITASEERFRTLANSISQLAWMADGSGSIYWYNQRFFDYTGITPEAMSDVSWNDIHHPAFKDMAEEFVQKGFQKGEPWEITLPLRGASGEYRWFLSRAYPVKDAQGNLIQWIGTNTDITEQREAATVLEQRVKERTLELEIRNAELEQFTYVSHHDLQEPLRKIIMFTDLIRSEAEGRVSDVSLSRLDKVAKAALRMSAALRDVLNFASLDKEEQFVQVDLNEIIASIQSDLELVISEKSASINSDPLPTIRAIPQQMHQLFYNLLSNALKFSKPGRQPEITITTTRVDPEMLPLFGQEVDTNKTYHKLTITDNGIGFGQDAAAMIFGMFQRLHSKDAYAGTGIGLALCRKVVQNHGGKIWAESTPGVGATFFVLLPDH